MNHIGKHAENDVHVTARFCHFEHSGQVINMSANSGTNTIQRHVQSSFTIFIFKKYQGHGPGKQPLHALEQDLCNKNFEQIRLRVAGDNARARHIYELCGFGVTGINMSKCLTAPLSSPSSPDITPIQLPQPFVMTP
ncbi:GNAT family N-acetyltransferase [Pantoea sp. VH_8]|uniref:GNAT family N-acetyltransferase n=2 Tax=Erwiniaceae TaxID=1903409 RepID=UPI00351BB2BF